MAGVTPLKAAEHANETTGDAQDKTSMSADQSIGAVFAEVTKGAPLALPPKTRAEHFINKLVFLLTHYEETKDRKHLAGMKKTLELECPDLKYAPYLSGNKGMEAFFDPDKPLSESDAKLLISELNVCCDYL